MSASPGLTFEDRVRAQEAIERVYYAHQINTPAPFSEAVPHGLIEGKVRRSIAQEVALERLWSVAITRDLLARELERVVAQTQMPGRLAELFAALGNDPVRIQECLIRPMLVDRLAREAFLNDASIHGEARREAESIHRLLAADPGRASVSHPRRDILTLRRVPQDAAEEGPAASPPIDTAGTGSELRLRASEFEQARRSLPRRPGEPGDVAERPEAYSVTLILSETPDAIRIARYTVPRPGWDAWWRDRSATFDAPNVSTVAAPVTLAPLAPDAATCPPDDTWSPFLPRAVDRHTAVWTGSEMIVWGGHYYDPITHDQWVNTGGRYDPAIDAWRPMSSSGAPAARSRHLAFWTGTQMIVWGGLVSGAYTNTGGRYDPQNDTWAPVTDAGAPAPDRGCIGVWTGQEMLIWCGSQTTPNQGARYNQSTDTWRPMSTVGAPAPRDLSVAAWTGSEMVVWGGIVSGGLTNTGGRYDPQNDTWTPTSTVGAPDPRYSSSAVWSGREVVIWGGMDNFDGLTTGGRYDPRKDQWRPTSTLNAPSRRDSAPAIWTGSEMIIWGGGRVGTALQTGGVYDPQADTWKPITQTQAPPARLGNTLVWTGSQMVVWGGSDSSRYFGLAARYDPVADQWLQPIVDGPGPRTDHSSVWTGSLMIVWGGQLSGSSVPLDSGGRYDPALASWTPTSTTNAPAARAGYSAIWTGREMIVYAGGGSNTGGRYDPAADSWLPISTTGALSPRGGYSVTWTGHEMIVWGGANLSTPSCCYFNDGARYDPASDTWRPMALSGAPSARADHSATWTGDRLIIWGGDFLRVSFPSTTIVYLGNGGIYDPSSDTWGPISNSGAPPPRANHEALWTGNLMIIWGGDSVVNGQVFQLNTGGRYDPIGNTWSPTSTVNAPNDSIASPRVALWTDGLMLIWGKNYFTDAPGTGGRYDPLTDTWSLVSTNGAPLPEGEGVWTGESMILWGGRNKTTRYFITPDFDSDGVSACAGDCNDRNPLVFPGAAEVCDGLDNNCNASIDEGFDLDGDGVSSCMQDCDDTDALVWSPPVQVIGFTVALGAPTPIAWTSQGASAGPGTMYELISVTRTGTAPMPFGSRDCLFTGSADNYADGRPDPPTGGFYGYLVRARNGCGTATYGDPNEDAAIPACF